ncbi:MAG TPA: ribosome-associated translation inhibitor RaiA [Dehalococcoidia bacterium]|nr:ribosome-associated translation inhibitor RaiA [Dehalococcoidia bacterium]
MELQITGQNMEVSSEVRQYVERKIAKLTRHFPNIIESIVEINQEKTRSPQQQFMVRTSVLGNGIRLRSEERGADLFQAFDKVTSVLDRQLERQKGKLYEKGKGSSLARGEFKAETAGLPRSEVVKVKRFAMKPMSVIEAAEQMVILGHSFFFFLNTDTDEFNVLYQRRDGNYGLIEPEMG